jgi:hypothetical protein
MMSREFLKEAREAGREGRTRTVGETLQAYGMTGEVTEADPPRRLEWTFNGDRYSYDLTTVGGGCQLVYLYTFDKRTTPAAQSVAGWDTYLRRLDAHFHGDYLSQEDAHVATSIGPNPIPSPSSPPGCSPVVMLICPRPKPGRSKLIGTPHCPRCWPSTTCSPRPSTIDELCCWMSRRLTAGIQRRPTYGTPDRQMVCRRL